MLFDEESKLLLMCNASGKQKLFVLPGGGIRLWEKPERSEIREVRRDIVHLFEVRRVGKITVDGYEVAEARVRQW